MLQVEDIEGKGINIKYHNVICGKNIIQSYP